MSRKSERVAEWSRWLDRATRSRQALRLRDVQEFADTSSGAKFTRQRLDGLMRGLRKARIDAAVAYKLDRLGRSLPHLVQLVAEMTTQRVAL